MAMVLTATATTRLRLVGTRDDTYDHACLIGVRGLGRDSLSIVNYQVLSTRRDDEWRRCNVTCITGDERCNLIVSFCNPSQSSISSRVDSSQGRKKLVIESSSSSTSRVVVVVVVTAAAATQKVGKPFTAEAVVSRINDSRRCSARSAVQCSAVHKIPFLYESFSVYGFRIISRRLLLPR